MPSVSKSRFSEKRGRVHGAPFRQVKGTVSPSLAVPDCIPLPPYALGRQPTGYPEPQIHDEKGRQAMRDAGKLAAEILAAAGELVQPGIRTEQIDDFVHRLTVSRGAYPSPLGYMGFPKSVCTSINEVVCHGIPDDTVIQRGDLVKIDVSCFVGGVHGDTCRTFIAGGEGATDEAGRALSSSTKAALNAAIQLCGPGVPIKAIGARIGELANAARVSSVAAFTGHGVGSVFHSQPIVYHTPNDSAYVMAEGMTFTIEPMLAEGTGDVLLWPDNWTVVTADGGRAAQFEHTLLVTAHGVEVLTRYD